MFPWTIVAQWLSFIYFQSQHLCTTHLINPAEYKSRFDLYWNNRASNARTTRNFSMIQPTCSFNLNQTVYVRIEINLVLSSSNDNSSIQCTTGTIDGWDTRSERNTSFAFNAQRLCRHDITFGNNNWNGRFMMKCTSKDSRQRYHILLTIGNNIIIFQRHQHCMESSTRLNVYAYTVYFMLNWHPLSQINGL